MARLFHRFITTTTSTCGIGRRRLLLASFSRWVGSGGGSSGHTHLSFPPPLCTFGQVSLVVSSLKRGLESTGVGGANPDESHSVWFASLRYAVTSLGP